VRNIKHGKPRTKMERANIWHGRKQIPNHVLNVMLPLKRMVAVITWYTYSHFSIALILIGAVSCISNRHVVVVVINSVGYVLVNIRVVISVRKELHVMASSSPSDQMPHCTPFHINLILFNSTRSLSFINCGWLSICLI
jgi:hypothetical protein